MPEAEARTLAQMRARRDEVERILLDNGWKIARQGARFFQWNRRDSEPLWTPIGEPRLDTAEEWASLLDQAAAIAVKPIDPVPSPAPKESGGVGGILDRATGPGTDGESDGCGHVAGPFPDSEAATRAAILAGDMAADAFAAKPHPPESRRDALVLRLMAAGFVEVQGPAEHLRRFNGPNGAVLIPVGRPCEVERDFEDMLNHAEKECAKVEDRRARQGTVSAVGRLLALGFVEQEPMGTIRLFVGNGYSVPIPGDEHDGSVRGSEEMLKDADRLCRRMEAAKQDRQGDAVDPIAPGPTVPELQEQIRALQAQLTAQKASNAKYVCDAALSGLRIVAESGPLARVAELEAGLASERMRANEWLSQLHDANERIAALKASNTGIAQELAGVDWTLNALGSSGTGPAKERLLQVLPRHRVADLRAVELAEAKASIARIRCRNPGMDTSEEPLKSAYAREAAANEALHEILDRMEAAKGRDHVPDAVEVS